MLQFVNRGPFIATPAVFPNPQGVDSVYVFVKGTFDLQGRLLPADQQVPLTISDQYFAEPLETSLKAPSDLTLGKPGTDVLLLGHALAPAGVKVQRMDVSLAVGPVKKTVRVFGKRTWRKALLTGLVATEPELFERMPLRWEHAFGGTVALAGELPRKESYPQNPVGAGFRFGSKTRPAEGDLLPQIENPENPIQSWKDCPSPVGFGPIASHWQPRLGYAGTYDEAWQKNRAPYMPKDFDPRYFHSASADQTVPGHLQGGEAVEILGVLASGACRFSVPSYRHVAQCRLGSHHERLSMKLETVFIDTDAGRMMLTWAGNYCSGRDTLRIDEITIDSTPFLTL